MFGYLCRRQGRTITKLRSGEILSRVYDNAMIPENINAGFYVAGIFPCDPDIMQSKPYASNTAAEDTVPGNGEICKLKEITSATASFCNNM
jgi:hypothetical protein